MTDRDSITFRAKKPSWAGAAVCRSGPFFPWDDFSTCGACMLPGNGSGRRRILDELAQILRQCGPERDFMLARQGMFSVRNVP